MNINLIKLGSNRIYRKKEFITSKFHEKLNRRKNKSQNNSIDEKHSQENKNKYSMNILFKKRNNNSIDRLNIPNIKRKNINIKITNTNRNYLYNKLNSSFPFYNLDYEDIIFNLNDIIYFTEETILYIGKYFHNKVCIK